MTAGQGDVGNNGVRHSLQQYNVRPGAPYTEWKVRFSQSASTAGGIDKENPFQTDSSQRISSAC